jgi:hypothetical protein
MRKSLITLAGLAAAAGITAAALTGCGTTASHPGAPASPPGATAPAAPAPGGLIAADVLSRGYFTAVHEMTLPPGMAGVTSAACGFNGNAEEFAVVYDTPARAAAAVTWYQGQRDALGMVDGQIIISQGPQTTPLGEPATVVTIFGDDLHMAQYVEQVTGANA